MLTSETGMAPVSLAEAQAYLRVDGGDEEALIAGLVRSASALCEQFTGQLLIERAVEERTKASSDWCRLSATPWKSISEVAAISEGSVETILPAGSYEIDIDSSGDGWIRLRTATDASSVVVRGVAGMASDANGVPEPVRQGILRLTAHLFEERGGEGGEPPAAVTALWRPYRRMRLK